VLDQPPRMIAKENTRPRPPLLEAWNKIDLLEPEWRNGRLMRAAGGRV